MYIGKDVVVCGHSLGDAIASIVAIKMQAERTRLRIGGNVKCVTFGAPLFGDKVLQNSSYHKNMHHFVCNNDPVPYLLNYAQTASLLVNKIYSQHPNCLNEEQLRATCYNYKNIINAALSRTGVIADIAAQVYPVAHVVSNVKNAFNIFRDIKKADVTNGSVYTPIGNFYFFDDKESKLKLFNWESWSDTANYTEQYFNAFHDNIRPFAHSLTYYE